MTTATICRMGGTAVISSGMARLGRLAAVVTLLISAFFGTASTALADHCDPRPAPEPIEEDRWWCHTPPPRATPRDTPEPVDTPEPTAPPAPTAAPTQAPQAPTTTRRPVIVQSTPESAPFDVEVPEENALKTPQIVVDGPLEGDTNFEVAEPTASVSSWIFGFIFGFIIGGLVGRASWGLRRKRRQQIFG
jgi:hypothetical protein